MPSGSVGTSPLTKLTYKLLCAGEVEEFDEAEVVSADQVEPGVRHARAVHVRFLRVPRPNAQNLVAKDTGTGSGCVTLVPATLAGAAEAHLVQVAQVILSITLCSATTFPEGTSYTCRP